MRVTEDTSIGNETRDLGWLFWIGFGLILLVGAFLRFYHIDNRPFHNDEGVNYFFIESIFRDGYFRYSHENYHGPSYFYLTTLFAWLFTPETHRIQDLSDFGMRASAIFMGVMCIAAILRLRKLEGDFFVLIAAGFVALSPSLVFYSRYAIHETLFLFAGEFLAISLYCWLRTNDRVDLFLSAISVALLVSTKETFIITLFCLFFATLALGHYRERIRAIFAAKEALFLSALCGVVVVVLFFTGGFQWGGGLREMWLAVPQWIGRNDSDWGHFKPFIYYAKVMWTTEPILLLLPVLPLVALSCIDSGVSKVLRSDKLYFLRYFITWAVLIFLVYSVVKYKTPWLIISITLPATLVIAWFVAQGCLSSKQFVSAISMLFAAGWFYVQSSNVIYYTFTEPYGQRNPFSYVHTSRGMVTFLDHLESYWTHHPGAKVLIGVDQYWPLPYYVRKHPGLVDYIKSSDADKWKDKYSVLVIEKDKIWDDPAWGREYHRLSDVQEAQIYFKR